MDPIFKYSMKVRDYECDAQGIVNNANYQHYYEVTRHEFLEKCGLNFSTMHDEGVDAVVSEITIKYKNSLRGSDLFDCTISLKKEGIRYIFDQKIIRISDNKICSEASVSVVILINGRLSKPDYLDRYFAQYL